MRVPDQRGPAQAGPPGLPARPGEGWRFLSGLRASERGRAVTPSLSTMEVLMDRLGHPERCFQSLHVTGTNGKSSTARYAASLLRAGGHEAGLYTSPHLWSVCERVEVGGEPIEESLFDCLLGEVAAIGNGLEISPFQAITAVGLLAFARAGVRVAVVEVGILGRFDATNVVSSEVAVITNVGHDHLDYAGSAPGAVAWEKAGIVKETTATCVAGSAAAELIEAIRREGPPRLLVYGEDFTSEPVGPSRWRLWRKSGGEVVADVPTTFHARNAITALVAVEALVGKEMPSGLVARSLEQVLLPGRAEVVSEEPLVLVDVAHNKEAAMALGEVLDARVDRSRPLVAVVGMTGARRPLDLLEPLVGQGDVVVACGTSGGVGAVPAEQVARDAALLGARALISASPEEGLEVALGLARATGGAVVVTGSFLVVGPIRALFA